MAGRRRVKLKVNPSAMLIAAAKRIELPALPVRLRYDPETDTLYMRFREDMEPNRTDDDLENGLIYDYHGRTLVGIETLGVSV